MDSNKSMNRPPRDEYPNLHRATIGMMSFTVDEVHNEILNIIQQWHDTGDIKRLKWLKWEAIKPTVGTNNRDALIHEALGNLAKRRMMGEVMTQLTWTRTDTQDELGRVLDKSYYVGGVDVYNEPTARKSVDEKLAVKGLHAILRGYFQRLEFISLLTKDEFSSLTESEKITLQYCCQELIALLTSNDDGIEF